MKDKIIAIVGVNDNPEKFGFKIFTDLLNFGYTVFAVGVRGGQVSGKKVYKSLKDLPNKPDVVVTVVPPAGTEKTVNDAIEIGIKEIWMQPGSESALAIEKAKNAGINVNRGCIMMDLGLW